MAKCALAQCCTPEENLLAPYNPDFSAVSNALPPGFRTDNTFTPGQIPGAGKYVIITARNWEACEKTPQYDHTQGNASGKYLWFDTPRNGPAVAWEPYDANAPRGEEHLIKIKPQTDYVFSVWLRDLGTGFQCDGRNSPIAEVYFNQQKMAEMDLSAYKPPCCPEWQQLCFTWNSGNVDTLSIQLVSAKYNGYTDLGIDDVFLGEKTTVPEHLLGKDRVLCNGESTLLDVTFPNANEIKWSTGSTTKSITVDQPGTYSVQYKVDGCAFRDEITFWPQALEPIDPLDTLCEGESVLVEVASPKAQYRWENGDRNPQRTLAKSGKYWVERSNRCTTQTDTLHLHISPAIEVDLGPDTLLCRGNRLWLNTPGVNNGFRLNAPLHDDSIAITTAGEYWVKLYNGGCEAYDTVMVYDTTFFMPDLGNDTTLCENQVLILKYDGLGTPIWWNGSQQHTQDITQNGSYHLEVQTHCGIFRDTLVALFDSLPFFALPKDTSICYYDTINLYANDGKPVKWMGKSTSSPALTVYGDTGSYWANRQNGTCSFSDTVQILDAGCEPILEMPNVFSPNGDDVNEHFIPMKAVGVENGTLVVYNRWGQPVGDESPLFRGWNGKTASDAPCASGTYFWVASYTDGYGKPFQQRGTLTLLY